MQWSTTDELLAVLIEMTDAVALRHLSALRVKRLPKVIHITRPFAPKPVKRKATSEDLRRIFGDDVRYVGSSS